MARWVRPGGCGWAVPARTGGARRGLAGRIGAWQSRNGKSSRGRAGFGRRVQALEATQSGIGWRGRAVPVWARQSSRGQSRLGAARAVWRGSRGLLAQD